MRGMIWGSSWCCLVENVHGKLPKAPQTAVCLPEQRAFLLINSPHLQPRRPRQIPLPRVQAQSRPLWFRITEQLPTDPQPSQRAAPVTWNSSSSPDTPRPLSPSNGSVVLDFRVPWTRKISKTHLVTDARLPTFCFARENTLRRPQHLLSTVPIFLKNTNTATKTKLVRITSK